MFAHKKDIYIIILILLTAIIIWAFSYRKSSDAQYAVIEYDGKIVKTVSLSEDFEFTLSEDETIKFSVKDGAISFINATCPDKICQNTGYLSKPGQTAICMPKKTILKVSGKNPDIDMVAT